MSCPNEKLPTTGQDCFFCPDGLHWDAHRIGWAIAGSSAAVTTLITLFTLTMHATHYQQPAAQRQVMRVLLMPPVYAIVSFFSYRYYQEYEYYVLAETAYEAITLSAFLLLLMELVALRTSNRDILDILKEKDKQKLPFPFGFWRFRASKPYFMHTLVFSVLQYVVIRPAISIAGIICEYYEVLCVGTYSPHFAEVYLEAIDFVSISVALYGLIVFYVLCKDELKGRRPLSKFMAIKLIVFFVFYQGFVFSVLQHYNVIKATDFWTADNVSDGLSALATTIEMVIFSAYMGWAYSWTDYTDREKNPDQRETNAKTYFSAIWDTINLSDFFVEIWSACVFFIAYMRGKPGTHSQPTKLQKTFLPHTMDDHEKLPMSSLEPSSTQGRSPTRSTRRTSSGTLMQDAQPRSPNERVEYTSLGTKDANTWRPSEDGSVSPALDSKHPFARPVVRPQPPSMDTSDSSTPQWGDSYSRQHPPGSAPSSASRTAFPDPQPYLAAPASSSSRNIPIPMTSPTYSPPGIEQSQSTWGTHLSAPSSRPFPSPHPTGQPLQPQPHTGSARSVHTLGTVNSSVESSRYATPAETPDFYTPAGEVEADPRSGGREPWAGEMNEYSARRGEARHEYRPRPESGIGIPGNPKLF